MENKYRLQFLSAGHEVIEQTDSTNVECLETLYNQRTQYFTKAQFYFRDGKGWTRTTLAKLLLK